MPTSSAADRLVVPFSQLRMTDVDSVGGKNASLGEMISQLAAVGVRVPGGFATTAHAFRQFLEHNGLAGRIADRLARAERRRRARPGQLPASRSAAGSSQTPVPGDTGSGHPQPLRGAGGRKPAGQLRGALLGHRRGPARCLLCRAAGDVPQRAGHRAGAAQGQGGVRLPVQRPRHQLPGPQGLRARRGRPVRGHPVHGALGSGRRGSDVHPGHRVGLSRCGLHHLKLRARRTGGAGRRESG